MCFWAHCGRFLCFFFRGVQLCAFFILDTSRSTLHLILWCTFGKPHQLVKMAELVCRGFFFTLPFILRRSFSLSVRRSSSTLLFRPSCGLLTMGVTVRVSILFSAVSLIFSLSASSFTIHAFQQQLNHFLTHI